MKFLHVVLHAWICSSIFWFIVYGNLNRICILLLFENCINLNYAELVHDAFFKSTLSFHFLYIHYINFWEFNIKTSTIFLGSKIIADGDCSHEIKRRLPPGRKVRTNLDSILKSKDTSLSTRLHLVKGMVFPVVMYGCESWAVKKAECRKIDAFELWCWRRLLRVPWTARRSNQSILEETVLGFHWKDWCWNWNSYTLATWCEELTHWKDLDAGKDQGQEEKWKTEDEVVGWHHRLNGHEFGWTPGVGNGQGGLVYCGSWVCKELDMTEQLNWAELKHLNLST